MTTAQKGTVYLVGAGPGDPELLTLRAADLLASGDVILHDDLVSPAILARAGAHARVISVGKRCGLRRVTQEQIHSIMIDEAQQGASVVRLKSGDPMVFGRAGEEIEALENVGIPFEVIPGVTAMFAAVAAAGRSLTDRRSASKIILATAHHASHADETAAALWSGPLPTDATLGIYMPGRDLRRIAWELIRAGLSLTVPCLVVRNVSLPGQRIDCTTLEQLADFAAGVGPLLILVGWPLAPTKDSPGVPMEPALPCANAVSALVS